MDVVIRAAESSDAEAIAIIMGCPGVVRGTLQTPYGSLEERTARVGQRLPRSHSLVAEVDGRVVGVIGLNVNERPRRRHVADLGMSVHDDFQGRGVGGALMAAIVDLAEGWLGITRIELTVYVDNVRAIRLYERFGFTVEGTAPRYALRDGEYVGAHYMARLKP